MAVGLEHPLVADYLRRLDSAAAVLPPGRRGELVEEIRTHVADALVTIGDDEASVRGVLDRLGEPEDIVGAEAVEPVRATATVATATVATATVATAPAAVRTPWGPLEVVAVLGLTVGSVLLPLLGPLIGLVCAWASSRWTRKEKLVATAWTALAPVVVVVLGLSLFLVRSSDVVMDPGPVSSVVEPAQVVQSPPEPVPSEPVPSVEVSR